MRSARLPVMHALIKGRRDLTYRHIIYDYDQWLSGEGASNTCA